VEDYIEETKHECCRLFVLQAEAAGAGADDIAASNQETKQKIENFVKRHECAGNVVCDSLKQMFGHRMSEDEWVEVLLTWTRAGIRR